MYKLMMFVFLLFASLHARSQAVAVSGSEAEEAYLKEYNKNIILTKLNGVYIPGSLKEAFKRLEKLSPPESIARFKAAPEKQVCKKLHFGLGRWMIENWSFYTGSRISHLLKTKGVLHPDDMAQFLLRTFHRHLNELPLKEQEIASELAIERKKVAEAARG